MAIDLGINLSSPASVLLKFTVHSYCPSRIGHGSSSVAVTCQSNLRTDGARQSRKVPFGLRMRETCYKVPRCTGSSSSEGSSEDPKSSSKEKVPFGYSRKDVLLIGLGVTLLGYGLKSGLEFVGVDSLKAGNAVQLILVLGLTVGWISTYIFRVSNKDMTYAQQLKAYEVKVMEKRLEGLTEAELAVLMEEVEEEKRRVSSGEQA